MLIISGFIFSGVSCFGQVIDKKNSLPNPDKSINKIKMTTEVMSQAEKESREVLTKLEINRIVKSSSPNFFRNTQMVLGIRKRKTEKEQTFSPEMIIDRLSF